MGALKYILPIVILGLVGCAVTGPQGSNMAAVTKAATKVVPGSFDWKGNFVSWFAEVEPFRIIGPKMGGIYFVGTQGLGMYFIPTEQGHIVIDGGMPGQGQYVADAISSLGFDPADIKILLNSHAHLDHSGGFAELKELSGAQLMASEGDRSALEGGFYLGSEDDSYLNTPPVKVDRLVADGELVDHGRVKLTAHITPGHTRGCTSWTMDVEQDGKIHEVLFFCSATVAANRLVGPPQYEGIVADYRKTFAITKNWKPDVFLSNHPEFFGFKAKREKQLASDPLAFVGADDFPKFIAKMAVDFEAGLQKQELKHNAIMSE